MNIEQEVKAYNEMSWLEKLEHSYSGKTCELITAQHDERMEPEASIEGGEQK